MMKPRGTNRCPQCRSPAPHHKMSCSDPSHQRGQRVTINVRAADIADVDTFLAIHSADEPCHGPGVRCLGCMMANEVRRLRALVEELRDALE